MELPAELWVKVIACSKTPEKNRLRKCSTTLYTLSSKNNMDIYIQDPLILNQPQGEYALLLCTYYNNIPAVKNLYRHGATHIYVYCGIAADPLDVAIHNQNEKLIKIVTRYGGTFRASKRFGYPLLPYPLAALLGDIDTLKKYIQSKKYNPVYKNENERFKGSTLLYPAIIKGHTNAVELLLTHPKTIQCINSGSKGGRAIDVTLMQGNVAVLKMLLAIPSLRIGKHSLCCYFNLCAKRGHTECMKLLLPLLKRYKISINKPSETGLCDGKHSLSYYSSTTPLIKAVFYGRKDTVDFLLKQKGIDVNVPVRHTSNYILDVDCSGTPLYIASLQGNADIVKRLLAHPKIKPCLYNRRNSCTALHAACEQGHLPVAQLLLEHSPQLLDMKTNDTHESPYQLAYHYNQYDMVEFLLSYKK